MSTATSRTLAKCEGASSLLRESSPPSSSKQAQPVGDDGTRTVGGASWSNNPPLQSQASTVSKVTSILRVNSLATGTSQQGKRSQKRTAFKLDNEKPEEEEIQIKVFNPDDQQLDIEGTPTSYVVPKQKAVIEEIVSSNYSETPPNNTDNADPQEDNKKQEP